MSHILLVKRPTIGIWGSLWSFPECPVDKQPSSWLQQHLPYRLLQQQTYPSIQHSFTHFDLTIQPWLLHVDHNINNRVMEAEDKIWYHPDQPLPGGIPKPVADLLQLIYNKPG